MKRIKMIGIPLIVLVLILVYVWFVVLPGKGGKLQTISTPPLSGPFSVGRTQYDWVDNGSKREIVAWVWYPTNAEKNPTKSASYLPGKWGHLTSESYARNINLRGVTQPFSLKKLWSAFTFNPPLSANSIEQLHIHAVDDAKISDVSTSYPMLLFSPGLGNMPTDYTAIIEDIVSHGYIVIGINPTYYTSTTVFADGRQVGMMLPWKINPASANMINTWVSDMVFALDQMTKVNEDQLSPLYHRLNLSKTGAFGHSYGGAAAVGATYMDPRIKAGIDIDGTPRGDHTTWNIKKPFMMLQSDHSPDSKMNELYQGLYAGYMVRIKTSLHRAFSDEVLFPLSDEQRNKLVGTINGERMIQITSAYIRAFFDYYLLNQASPLLAGPTTEFPEISIEKSPNFSEVPSN
jgi:dienelactone hydrolase